MIKTFTLPSTAVLEVDLAPFADGKALYQAFLEEVQSVKLDPSAQVDVNMWKEFACIALSSKKVEKALWVCLGRATYNKLKVTPDTFEPEEARQDYFDTLMHVAEVNVRPFTKPLLARYKNVLELIRGLVTQGLSSTTSSDSSTADSSKQGTPGASPTPA